MQRGKVLGSVVVVVVVVIVVIAKMARSRVLGIPASANCRSDVENSEKTRSGASKL